MSENKKPLRVFHVDDDSNIRNSIESLVINNLEGEYFGAYDFKEFESQVYNNLEDFDDYNVVFISDGQFPANKYKYSEAYLEVIDFLQSEIEKREFKLLVISGSENIVEDAMSRGFKDSLVKPINLVQVKKIIQSYME